MVTLTVTGSRNSTSAKDSASIRRQSWPTRLYQPLKSFLLTMTKSSPTCLTNFPIPDHLIRTRAFDFTFSLVFSPILELLLSLGIMGRHLSGRGRMWWSEECMPRSKQVGAYAGGKGNDLWDAEGDDQHKDKNTKSGARWSKAWRSRSELRCRSSGAISSGCFVLFGFLWSVRLSDLKAH